jgi:release factor glutamine methyltransferase
VTSGPATWRELLAYGEGELAAIDARRIVEAASGWEGAEHGLHLDDQPTERTTRRFLDMVERRRQGEPLQYVIGSWGFRRLDLFVDRRVLIPRPETEQVAGAALGELDRLASGRRLVAVDLGTGSGAIALALAAERRQVHVWATDQSEDALAVARANLAGLGRDGTRVRLAAGDWWSALPDDLRGGIAVAVANPPYVAESEIDGLPPEVAVWEPTDALVAGPTGLEAIETIVAGAPPWLSRPGAVVIEHAPHQSEAVAALARRAGFAEVETRRDLAGRDRMVVARIG